MEQSHTCCVCLKSKLALVHIREPDCNNTQWIQKLSSCVPEVLWCEEYLICHKCIAQLEIASAFKKLCLESYIEHQQQWEKRVQESVKSANLKVNSALGIVQEVKGETYEILSLKNENLKALKKSQTGLLAKLTHTSANSKEDGGNISLLRHLLQTKQETVESKPSTSRKNNAKHVPDIIVIDDEENDDNFTATVTKNSKTDKEAQSHEDINLNQRKYKCKICLKSFNLRASVILHVRYKHIPPNEWQCPHCHLGFPRRHILKQHILMDHTHPGGDYICLHCNEGFPLKSGLIAHLTSEHNFKTKKCRLCNNLYGTQSEYDEHLLEEHNVNILKKKKYRCRKCCKMYASEARNGHHDECLGDTGLYISGKKLNRGLEEEPRKDQAMEELVGSMVS